MFLKHNSNREKQVILLVISEGEKLWHYLSLPCSNYGIISNTKRNYIKK